MSANNLLTVTSPASVTGATGYNVYVATTGGKETLQTSTPIAVGINWTEATGGITTTGEGAFINGVGDSNLSQMTAYPDTTASHNRVSNFWYDWRDRQVAAKAGVQSSEDTTTHRPIMYTTFDNLDEATKVQRFDGDTVTVTPSAGVPQAPSSSSLRAEADYSYDDQMRPYLKQVGKVDPVNGGNPTVFLNTNYYYNHRGSVIETGEPGVSAPGVVTKNVYDGAGRVTTTYQTDGSSGTTWTNAGSVSSDYDLAPSPSAAAEQPG